jgi:hypothetical protein
LGVKGGPLTARGPRESSRGEPRPVALLAVFGALTVALAYPGLAHFGTRIPGDGGDSLLNLWIVRSVQIGLPHGWHSMWNTRIFFPRLDTLAYSDTLLPVALVHWILRTISGDVIAFNVIYVGTWVMSSWCMYLLARRFVTHWGAAFVAALAYTYSAIRLVHYGHLQLVVGGALVPLVLELLLRCLNRPSMRRGIILGVAFALLTLTASYYGAMTGVFVVVIVFGWVLTADRSVIRAARVPLAVAAAVVAVLTGPVGIHYLSLERSSAFRRPFDPAAAAHLSDFLRTGYGNPVLSHLPAVGPRSRRTVAGVENRLFPGVVAVSFGAVGLCAVGRRRKRRATWPSGRGRELAFLVAAGAIVLVLSFGDRFTIGGHRVPLPFAAFRAAVPGFAGIRATARLVLGSELALALVAAVGVDALLRRCHRRGGALLVTIILASCVVIESPITLNFVQVPTTNDDGGVQQALASEPAGVVLELPIESSAGGVAWPYVEAPRELLALRDGHPRVNGYSGFQPPDFDQRAATLNRFPDDDAVAEAKRVGVRYVVLRTKLVSTSMPVTLRRKLNVDGVGRYTAAHAHAIVSALPPAIAADVVELPGGYLIDLGP